MLQHLLLKAQQQEHSLSDRQGSIFRGALSTKTAQHAKDLLMQKAYITPNVQAISFLLLADA